MKKRKFGLIAGSLAVLMLTAACTGETTSSESESIVSSSSVSLSVSEGESSPVASSKTPASETGNSNQQASSRQTAPSSKPVFSSSPDQQAPPSSGTAQVPAQPHKPVTETPKPVEIPAMQTAPAPEPTPQPSPSPAPEPTPQPAPPPVPEPVFDINYWVNYGISYGQGIGLTADSSATSCWDTPITAGPNSTCLERDICGRLDWYKSDGMTGFWIWASPRGDGKFDYFIGYS